MKHYKDQLKTLPKKCNINPTDLEDAVADRSTWRQLYQSGVQRREKRNTKRQQKQLRRHTTMPVHANTDCICPTCNKVYVLSLDSTVTKEFTVNSEVKVIIGYDRLP